ncbi:MAG: alanine--tRNA ligase-related protein [Patescibacteria group bacterium]
MIQSEEVRKLFFDFFAKRGHKVIPSSSLIPENDVSVLLTTAGMQQFKKYFTGENDAMVDFGTQRICSIQKCFRTTDISEIGDETHLTFFEMLGNFSFNGNQDEPKNYGTDGYFKKSSIYWAKEFFEETLGLKIDYPSIFKGERGIPVDNESYKIWKELGIGDDLIKKFGRKDNFWGPTGDEGPCGPTTEIYVNNVEVWNIVFNEYYQDKNGKLEKLKFHGVDTGIGFERLISVINNTPTIFETDLFEGLKNKLLDKSNNISERDLRIILDHLRSSVFLISDGVYPSNLERGYILRRILRRLVLKLKQNELKLKEVPVFLNCVIEKFGDIYPELNNREKIEKVFFEETEKFEKTLEKGLRKFDKIIKEGDPAEVLGEKFFILNSTYGLPFEISEEIAQERGLNISKLTLNIFKKLFEKHQKTSKQTN